MPPRHRGCADLAVHLRGACTFCESLLCFSLTLSSLYEETHVCHAAMETPAPRCVLRSHQAEVTAMQFSSCCDSIGLPLLMSGAADGELRLWSLHTQRSVASIAAHAGSSILAVHDVAGSHVLSQGRDGYICLWDLQGGLCSGPALQSPYQCHAFCQCALAPGQMAPADAPAGQLLIALSSEDGKAPNAPAAPPADSVC